MGTFLVSFPKDDPLAAEVKVQWDRVMNKIDSIRESCNMAQEALLDRDLEQVKRLLNDIERTMRRRS